MNQNTSEYYWSLVIEDGWLQAAIWSLSGEYVRVMSTGPSTKWSSAEDLVDTADGALSAAVVNFPEDEKEPSKTVFGVPPLWVEDGQIKREHLDKIRQLATKLSLSPIGFVVLPEAIAHMVKLKEGSPVSGIVVGVGETMIDVTLFRLGNLVGTVNVGRSVSIVEDVIEGLSRFSTGEGLPSRIMLYDGNTSELEALQEDLTEADWGSLEGKVKFLHSPQVEIIDPKAKTVAVCAAGASELGNVAGLLVDGESQDESEKNEAHEHGTSQGNVIPAHDLTPEDVGFVVGEEVKNFSDTQMPDSSSQEMPAAFKQPFKMPKFSFGNLPFHLPVKNREPAMPHPSVGNLSTTPKWKRLMVFGVIFVVLVITGGIGGWWYLPRAEIVVFLAPQNLEETESLTLDENIDQADVEARIFPAQTVAVEVTGSKSRAATGNKTVGDAAAGQVTIRNGTASDIVLESGTSLQGPGDLEYTINEEVTVGSATSPSDPGSVTTAVTASDIGAQYNIASGENFSVSNYPTSEVDAVSEGELSGGSSREVVAVSADDREKLGEELTEELKSQGIAQIEGQIESTSYFVSDAVRTEEVDTSFSKAEGDEASSVDLDMSLRVIGIVVSKEQLESLARDLLEPKVPTGYALRSEQIDVSFELDDESDGAWFFDASITANLLPEINTDDIKRNVIGKYPSQAQQYLTTIPGFTKADITLTPSLPGKLGNIPRVTDHVSIEIIADR